MTFNLAGYGTSNVKDGILFAKFNQEATALAIGCNAGYQIFHLSSVNELTLIFDNKGESSEICLMERFFSSGLLAYVSLASPTKLTIYNFQKATLVDNFTFPNTILSVRMNRLCVVVVLEEAIHIYNFKDMKVKCILSDTAKNCKGLCCLSIDSERPFLAYPASNIVGEVEIFNVTLSKPIHTMHAHNGPLGAMTFNKDATKLATASTKGTVIRVFSVPDGQKLMEFRRGVKRYVTIGSLDFSPDSLFLCVSSNTETVHIFKLENANRETEEKDHEGGSWTDYFSKMLTTSVSYISVEASEVLSQERSFATVKLPFNGMKNVCAISKLQEALRVLVIDEDGYLYIYNFDPINGGECTLVRQYNLLRAPYLCESTGTQPTYQDNNLMPHLHAAAPEQNEMDKIVTLTSESHSISSEEKANS